MTIDAQPPTPEQSNPYIPPGPPPLICEQFQGINTSTTRPGVDDKQLYWCDGFIPIGPLDLRVLPDVGPPLFAVSEANSVIAFFDFANIGSDPYAIVFTSDGDIWAVNTDTAVAMLIAPDTTIENPARGNIGITQYGDQYVIIVSKQDNGYFIWDGTIFYSPGSLAPVVTITNNGAGYTGGATASVSGGSGSGATFSVTVVDNIVVSIAVTNPGSGYLANDTVTMTISGTHTIQATATVELMPLGISGTAVETYSGHVWVANGPEVSFTAPGSVTDFSPTDGGGNFSSPDSFLRVGYIQLLSTNGFLYLIGDSSVNYISGVQTSATVPPITTFSNQNADPEVGTPYPATVDVFGRNILFANAFGAHVSYGAAVTKISEALDGVYNTVPGFGGFAPSAAKAIIFGKKVWILLMPIIDPVTGTQTNKLFMWNGKIWWSSSQSINLLYIQHQEINSVLTAWGTDGISLYPLFQTPSTAFRKTIQSKMWSVGGYINQKAVGRVWGLGQFYGTASPTLTVSVDNEFGPSTQTISFGLTAIEWLTTTGLIMNWVTTSGSPMTWFVGGISAFSAEPVGQIGTLLGFTATTNTDDFALISLAMQPEIVGYRG